MLKRLYIEITNACNLHCYFCGVSERPIVVMSEVTFEQVLIQSQSVCDYVYLHVKGEPLMHPKLLKLLDLCHVYGKKVHLVTNGTLLAKYDQRLFQHLAIRKFSISLQGYFQWDLAQENVEVLTGVVKQLLLNRQMLVELRLWTGERAEAVAFVQQLSDNLYVSYDEEFVWPSLNDDYQRSHACLGPKMMLAVLSDGTITPCCLDQDGLLSLGNISAITLSEALAGVRYAQLVEGFRNNRVVEDLCRHCRF
jgi:organic radical activating enzyme